MSDQSYSVEQTYLRTYQGEVAPAWLHALTVLKGRRAPPPDRPIRMADFGCGSAYTLILLASANPQSQFTGIDFEPDHIAEAQAMIDDLGLTNIRMIEAGFADMLRDPKRFGQFDVICCHGVYTWIDEDVRIDLDAAIHACLAPGGLVYLGYNAMPGWAVAQPLRDLVQALSRGRSGTQREAAIDEALAFFDLLKRENTGILKGHPALARWLAEVADTPRRYRAHEYLPSSAGAMWHRDVADRMAAQRLGYLGSARLSDIFDRLNFPDGLREALQDADRRGLGETMRDVAADRTFRWDVFARGLVSVPGPEAEAALEGLCLIAAIPPIDKPTIVTANGLVEVAPGIAGPILDMLRDGPRTLGATVARAADQGIDPGAARMAVLALLSGGCALPVATTTPSAQAIEACERFNAMVLGHRHLGSPALASPILGGGLPLRSDQRKVLHGEVPEGKGDQDLTFLRHIVPGL